MHSDWDSCAPEVMVPDARVFSSMKNEEKHPWLYDNVLHQGYLSVGLTGAHPSYENFTSSTSNSEHRTLEGYLYKKGALLKGWKQRWFVLDSTKHQMRYYDSMEDPNCKGYIDLFDVQAVHPIKNVQGPLKSKSEENAAFELKTSKRLYHFIASDAKTAQEWIDKIHSFI